MLFLGSTHCAQLRHYVLALASGTHLDFADIRSITRTPQSLFLALSETSYCPTRTFVTPLSLRATLHVDYQTAHYLISKMNAASGGCPHQPVDYGAFETFCRRAVVRRRHQR